jgi:hypothetical protein
MVCTILVIIVLQPVRAADCGIERNWPIYNLLSSYYNTLMKISYYRLDVRLRPGWRLPQAKTLRIENGDLMGVNSSLPLDPAKWKDPPHVAFANLGYDPARRAGVASDEDIIWFTSYYGPLDVMQGQGAVTEQATPSDVLEAAKRIFAPSNEAEPFWLSLGDLRFLQAQLQTAWKEKNPSLFIDPQNSAKSFGYDFLPVTWQVKGSQLEMCPASCFHYMGILLTRDLAEKRTRVCQNQTCPAPYYVAGRRDSKFCSHPCAATISQRNFRKRHRRKK